MGTANAPAVVAEAGPPHLLISISGGAGHQRREWAPAS